MVAVMGRCSVLQRAAVCCNVLQCVVVYSSVLQCVAVYCCYSHSLNRVNPKWWQ